MSSYHMPREIIKRSGKTERYDSNKIKNAMGKVFTATGSPLEEEALNGLLAKVEQRMAGGDLPFSVEAVQDMVERVLMEAGYFDQAKSYILYRETRRKKRQERQKLADFFPDFEPLGQVLLDIEKDFPEDSYDVGILHRKFLSLYKEDKELEERMSL